MGWLGRRVWRWRMLGRSGGDGRPGGGRGGGGGRGVGLVVQLSLSLFSLGDEETRTNTSSSSGRKATTLATPNRRRPDPSSHPPRKIDTPISRPISAPRTTLDPRVLGDEGGRGGRGGPCAHSPSGPPSRRAAGPSLPNPAPDKKDQNKPSKLALDCQPSRHRLAPHDPFVSRPLKSIEEKKGRLKIAPNFSTSSPLPSTR